MQNPLRKLPSISQLLESKPLKTLVNSVSHNAVANAARGFLDHMRHQVNSATESLDIPSPQEMAEKIADWIKNNNQKNALVPVINGTGIILHTGLGRSPLPESAITAVQSISEGYASLEVDISSGKRGRREHAVKPLLCELTGAESATVVNNNAAATMITLSALGQGREVIVSRGQLVEIGGSFRLPEVMKLSGARLVDVGTTNKTRVSDYEDSINENTAALLRVHPSNFKVIGFTEETSLEELVALGKARKIPVIDDVGSGALIDFSKYGLSEEPVVSESLQQGADLVLFSGDKLVGGPQCGIIVGKRKYIDQITSHPMMRAMRVDKMTLAALRSVLELYRHPEKAEFEIPLLAMLSTPLENLKLRANRLGPQIQKGSQINSVEVLEDQSSMLGGGSLPAQSIPTICLNIIPENMSVTQFANEMRSLSTPVFGRVHHDMFLLDLRTIEPKWDTVLAGAFAEIGEHADSQPENLD